MPQGWSREAADFVDSTTVCPRCDATLGSGAVCPRCGALLSGEQAVAVRRASEAAAAALRERQRLIDLLPTADRTAPLGAPVRLPSAGAAGMPPAPAGSASAPSRASGSPSQVTVPSVLAVVGAALVAIAALVFTFLNPELPFGVRTAIVGVLTALFLGAAWLLTRRRLRLSAEAVGALGMVFVVLDIWAVVQKTPLGLSGWVPAAIGTLVASGVMLGIAVASRLRVWLWTSLVGLVLVPAMFGYALANAWATHAGHVAAGLVACGAHVVIRRIAGRFDSPLRADHGTLTTLQLVAAGVVAVTLPFSPDLWVFHSLQADADGAWAQVLGRAVVLLGLALLAALGAREQLPRLGSVLTGAWIALAAAQSAFVPLHEPSGRLALLPLTTVAAVVALTALPTPRPLARRPLLVGAIVVGGFATIPALAELLAELVSAGAGVTAVEGQWAAVGSGIAAIGAAATGFLASWRGDAGLARAGRIAGLWLGAAALLTLAAWAGWSRTAGAVFALATALVLALVLLLLPAVRSGATWLRLPMLVTGHLLLLVAVISSWIEDPLTVPVGAAVVAVLVPLGLASPRPLRPVTLGIGYAYALLVFATGLSRAGVESIAVLCLTASLAAVVGLAATLVTRLRAALWYAVLVVTVVPFLVGVGSVLAVRSGWTALSTGLIFLLALTLLLTRRPGLNRVVRTMAAAILVPALAVVVICLGAQLLDQSASPVTLPIIAVIVAAALCATAPLAAALTRHGLAEPDARVARIAIEASSLLTGAIAVLLSLVREAAGLGTTLVVLLILGVGAAATAVFAKRAYGWWVAGLCWSGALWCALSLAGVQVVEPYVLPPALGLAVVGVVVAARGAAGLPLVATGLAAAVLTTLVLLAVAGPGDDRVPWRTLGLLVGAAALLLLSGLTGGRADRHGRLAGLHLPVLLSAVAASAAGAVQGVRWAVGADPLAVADGLLVLPVLGLALVAVALAAAGARLLVRRVRPSRWVLVPATLFLVAGPVFAIRDIWLPIWTLWGLMLALLVLVVLIALRGRRGPTTLPPVWFVWGAAWITGVASWSARELRVEVYSIPLAVALLAAGAVVLLRDAPEPDGAPLRRTLTSWPSGFRGSWPLLGPGIAALFLPSLLSTGTDPQTWRAIMVIALALAAILVGSLFKLGAPFILGIAVLPIENIVVFAVQVGRSIGSTPWWITLASAGAVLLVIAATWERRSGGERGVAARLRDLR